MLSDHQSSLLQHSRCRETAGLPKREESRSRRVSCVAVDLSRLANLPGKADLGRLERALPEQVHPEEGHAFENKQLPHDFARCLTCGADVNQAWEGGRVWSQPHTCDS